MKIYDLGEMRRRTGQRTGRTVAEGGAPATSPSRRVHERTRLPSRWLRRRQPVGENVAPHRPDETDPVILTAGRGPSVEPFLTVHKNPEEFAACNALAEKIGPIDTPKKAYQLIEDAIGDEVNEVFGLMTLDLHNSLQEHGDDRSWRTIICDGPTGSDASGRAHRWCTFC